MNHCLFFCGLLKKVSQLEESENVSLQSTENREDKSTAMQETEGIEMRNVHKGSMRYNIDHEESSDSEST